MTARFYVAVIHICLLVSMCIHVHTFVSLCVYCFLMFEDLTEDWLVKWVASWNKVYIVIPIYYHFFLLSGIQSGRFCLYLDWYNSAMYFFTDKLINNTETFVNTLFFLIKRKLMNGMMWEVFIMLPNPAHFYANYVTNRAWYSTH